MPIPDSLKPGSTWGCPMCKRQVTMYTEGVMKGSLRPHKAGDAGIAPPKQSCLGAGFSPYRPAWPQYVRMYGLDGAIADMRHVHGPLDWTPKPMQPGKIQEFVLAAWPQAKSFVIVGSGDRRGLVFTVGPRRWHYATHDADLSKRYDLQAEALDAFDEHEKEG